eukprot:TRINITY_DN2605_c0_g1_i1.p1 TRINITY_DN2605_c0_g1~~TRINITY_DN2605_c0_g1_i1.p1  ORF type:complete len:278 (+),score=39.28 TRINITY_DN2605_c0_g1_i1:48-881(+)
MGTTVTTTAAASPVVVTQPPWDKDTAPAAADPPPGPLLTTYAGRGSSASGGSGGGASRRQPFIDRSTRLVVTKDFLKHLRAAEGEFQRAFPKLPPLLEIARVFSSSETVEKYHHHFRRYHETFRRKDWLHLEWLVEKGVLRILDTYLLLLPHLKSPTLPPRGSANTPPSSGAVPRLSGLSSGGTLSPPSDDGMESYLPSPFHTVPPAAKPPCREFEWAALLGMADGDVRAAFETLALGGYLDGCHSVRQLVQTGVVTPAALEAVLKTFEGNLQKLEY